MSTTYSGKEVVMLTDVEKLKEAIVRSGLKKTFIADQLGITYAGYNKKETGKSEFLASEIVMLKNLLHLSNKEVSEIFLLSK